VGHVILPANHKERRTLRILAPFYARRLHREPEIALEEKPEVLEHVDAIDQKVWKQYETFLKATAAWERAEFYARQMEERGVKTAASLAKVVGDPDHMISRYLRLMELPTPILDHLKAHRTPENLKYFSHRMLEELVRLGNPKAAWRRFQEMLGEAKREAGVWAKCE